MEHPRDFWSERARGDLVGRRIVGARYLTEEECAERGWRYAVLVIELDDGRVLVPSMDDEGNEGGSVLGLGADGADDGGYPVVDVRG